MKINYPKISKIISFSLLGCLILTSCASTSLFDDGEHFVKNNIQKVSEKRLLLLAAEMNKPTVGGVLMEGAEMAVVAGIAYMFGSTAGGYAAGVKTARTVKKTVDKTIATKKSYTFLNKVIKPFYKASARSFDKKAIRHISKTPGVYLFFNKSGQVKYVGKAMDLKLRVGQHLRGKSNSGNQRLSDNAKDLSFIVIPIKPNSKNKDIAKGAIKCIEAVAINAFNNGSLYNKRIEKINKDDCKQLMK